MGGGVKARAGRVHDDLGRGHRLGQHAQRPKFDRPWRRRSARRPLSEHQGQALEHRGFVQPFSPAAAPRCCRAGSRRPWQGGPGRERRATRLRPPKASASITVRRPSATAASSASKGRKRASFSTAITTAPSSSSPRVRPPGPGPTSIAARPSSGPARRAILRVRLRVEQEVLTEALLGQQVVRRQRPTQGTADSRASFGDGAAPGDFAGHPQAAIRLSAGPGRARRCHEPTP